MKRNINLYLRDVGPICYEAEVLPMNDRRALEVWTTNLISTDFDWCWESARARPSDPNSPYNFLPEQRALTLLNHMQKETFVGDLSERDIDGYARFIAIFGLDKGVSIFDLSSNWLVGALRDFMERESGAIHIVIIQIGDSQRENIFVRHNAIESARLLLESWGISESTISRVVPYKSLYIAKLESLYESILTIAQG